MKVAVLVLIVASLASAAPKATKLGFLNLYKEPLSSAVPSPRIIGGQEAVPHSLPYSVYLEIYSVSNGWYCGGTLISQYYIMTAAHCGVNGTQAYAILGAHRPTVHEPTQIQAISTNIIVHSGYDSEYIENDIAVLGFTTPIPLSDNVQIIPLPTLADVDNTYAGDTGIASGWGYTHGTDNSMSEVLNYAELLIITNEECEQVFGELDDAVMCTSGDHNSGTCNGDSGGPLAVDGVQVGIVSFGVRACPVGFPVAYTRITTYLDWLAEHTDVTFK